jgi:hypothetical protein
MADSSATCAEALGLARLSASRCAPPGSRRGCVELAREAIQVGEGGLTGGVGGVALGEELAETPSTCARSKPRRTTVKAGRQDRLSSWERSSG